MRGRGDAGAVEDGEREEDGGEQALLHELFRPFSASSAPLIIALAATFFAPSGRFARSPRMVLITSSKPSTTFSETIEVCRRGGAARSGSASRSAMWGFDGGNG